MLMYMLSRHIITLFLILIFGIKLCSRKSFRDMDTKFFWVPTLSCLVLVLEDVLESIAALDPTMRFWRILFSVIGYSFRSAAAVGLLLVIVPHEKRKLLPWIPCIINLLICCTAFFTDIAFGFDENYAFYRGPLGIVPFIVPMLYMLLILWSTARNIIDRSGTKRWVVSVSVLFCVATALVDTVSGGTRINDAIMISSVFFYILLYSHDNRRDPLTGLLNRQAFYDDCRLLGKDITAVASLDMNGLKELNDTQGHKAGDEALKRIGECISESVSRSAQAYRVGGDEFLLLFFRDTEEAVAAAEKRVRESVKMKGYNISVGYAMLGQDTELDAAISKSDKLMYEDKARFYRESGRDRRRR